MSDLISRQAAINGKIFIQRSNGVEVYSDEVVPVDYLKHLQPAESERLSDDDFETIKIHLNAQKEKLCNQKRWEEAEEYQRIIDRFMVFASAEPERKNGKWIEVDDAYNRIRGRCSVCGWEAHMYEDDVVGMDYCPNCGADMRGDSDEIN